ncbi:Di-copper centre-containing protein [Pseudovirgaria hyperparasitica]|uniref:tyrosinase n=1 Tax=Pseudovirgaria hyperparasitica TaxID=470096 RepID=A0A6A6WLA0_9PEZI|nr:Di-copper centre-containing protein [Pseudovirgaria hyperparasitica]KAF2762779.1 Di-copper centre-containing protein [Pseudovirgaria hyperparasitica]
MVSSSLGIFAVVAFITSVVLGSPNPVSNARRQQNFLAVTGATVGGTQPRIEIRDLKSQPEAWNLFLLAWARFQAMDQNARSSYYQIAGIHGQPNVAWDGVQSTGVTNAGYCLHGSNLFGTWHKPYLALFEQVLSLRAREIAAEFPAGAKRDRYVQEAAKLRLPYWDWGLESSNHDVLPDVMTDATASVTFPNGTTTDIPNPLLRYSFHPLPPNVFSSPWSDRNVTWRTSPTEADDIAAIESRLSGENTNIRTTLYQILTQYQSFNQFSNTGSEQSLYGSLEGIHNNIHSTFNGGHMGAVPVAAFDPLFWVHHANVDRIMHIFMKLYPDTYVTPYEQSIPSFMARRGQVYNAGTRRRPFPILSPQSPVFLTHLIALWPFHSTSSGEFWTSNSIRPTTVNHYTYPELADNPSNETLKARINALYRPMATSVASPNSRAAPRAYLAVVDAPLTLAQDDAMGGIYSIDIFLGPGTASSPPLRWPTDSSYVGSTVFLGNARGAQGDVVRNSVELTQALKERFDRGQLSALDQDSVLAYLKDNLSWRVEQEGVELDVGSVSGLRISVRSTEVSEGGDGFPKFGDWSEHGEITTGRPGGVKL